MSVSPAWKKCRPGVLRQTKLRKQQLDEAEVTMGGSSKPKHFPVGSVRIIPLATYDDLPDDAGLGDWGAVYHILDDDIYKICSGCGIEAGYCSVEDPQWLPRWFEPTP